MSPERSKKAEEFKAKYPLCFADGIPRSGFYAAEGWTPLLHKTFALLEYHLESMTSEVREGLYVAQVKEKFGTLRIYFNKSDQFMNGVIALAESLTNNMCDVCGAPAERSTSKTGYLQTVCKDHANT